MGETENPDQAERGESDGGTSSSHTILKLTDAEDAAAKQGFSEIGEVRFVNGELDTEHTGLSHHRLRAGVRQPFGHRHERAEEVYVLISGSGRVKLDDEIAELDTRSAPSASRPASPAPSSPAPTGSRCLPSAPATREAARSSRAGGAIRKAPAGIEPA